MKFKVVVIVTFLLALTVFAGSCTSARSEENVRLETARAIGGITSEQVTISNLNVGMKTATWDAETPLGRYKCESDDMLKRGANCVKQP